MCQITLCSPFYPEINLKPGNIKTAVGVYVRYACVLRKRPICRITLYGGGRVSLTYCRHLLVH